VSELESDLESECVCESVQKNSIHCEAATAVCRHNKNMIIFFVFKSAYKFLFSNS